MLQIKYVYLHQHPKVVELVDTPDLESGILNKDVRVRVSSLNIRINYIY